MDHRQQSDRNGQSYNDAARARQSRSTFGPDVFAFDATPGTAPTSRHHSALNNSISSNGIPSSSAGLRSTNGLSLDLRDQAHSALFNETAYSPAGSILPTSMGQHLSQAPASSHPSTSGGSRFFNHSSMSPLNSPSASAYATTTQSPLHQGIHIARSPAATPVGLQSQSFRPTLARTRSGAPLVPKQEQNSSSRPVLPSASSMEQTLTDVPEGFGPPRRSATAGPSLWASPKLPSSLKPVASRTSSPGLDIWTSSPLVKDLKTPSRSNSANSDSGVWAAVSTTRFAGASTTHPQAGSDIQESGPLQSPTALSFAQSPIKHRGPPTRSKTLAPHREASQGSFVSESDSLLPTSLQAAVAVTLEPEELETLRNSPPSAHHLDANSELEQSGSRYLPPAPKRNGVAPNSHLKAPQRSRTLDPERHLPKPAAEPILRSSPSVSGLIPGGLRHKDDHANGFSDSDMSLSRPARHETLQTQRTLHSRHHLPQAADAAGDEYNHRLRHTSSQIMGRSELPRAGTGIFEEASRLQRIASSSPHEYLRDQQSPSATVPGKDGLYGRREESNFHGPRPDGTVHTPAQGAVAPSYHPQQYHTTPSPSHQSSQLQHPEFLNSLTAADAAAILRNQELIYQALTANSLQNAAAGPWALSNPALGISTPVSGVPYGTHPAQQQQQQLPHQVRPSNFSQQEHLHAALNSMSLSEPASHANGHMGSGLQPSQQYQQQPPAAGHSNFAQNPRSFRSQPQTHGPLRSSAPAAGKTVAGPAPSSHSRQQQPASGAQPRSHLLEEFRNRRAVTGLPLANRPSTAAQGASEMSDWTLDHIRGHIVEFCLDQHGSRFAQEQLDRANRQQIDWVFEEIRPMARPLMQDVFGNYVVQKVFEYGSDAQRLSLTEEIRGHVVALSLGTYGCRVIQKALDYLPNDVRLNLAMELKDTILELVQDQNANHVVQKLLSVVDNPADVNFVPDAFHGRVLTLGAHCYSCRVLQRIFERCEESQARPLLDELCQNALTLVQSPFGNYGVQYVLELNDATSTQAIIRQFLGKVSVLSVQKYSSNVIEKCIRVAEPALRRQLISELLEDLVQLEKLLQDRFGNYVVQTALDSAEADQRSALIEAIRSVLPTIRNDPYGKRIQTKLQPVVAEQGAQNSHQNQRGTGGENKGRR